MTPSKFIEYVFIGFGATVGFILLAVAMWVLIRRHLHRRRQARLLHGAAAHRPDARRQQTEAVQRMIEEKRKAARAARKPVLVVHPGGDAVVAFQEAAPKRRASLDGEPGLIKAQHRSQPGGHEDPAACARDLLGRRAMVAAAALSGRTVSGLSDMLADASDAASDDLEGAEPPQQQEQQQQQQQDGSSQGQTDDPAALLPAPPPSGILGTGSGSPAFLTRLARHHARGSDDIV